MTELMEMGEYIVNLTPKLYTVLRFRRGEEIVRCRDCKHYCESTVDEDGEGEPSWCTYWGHEWLRDDGFCAWGERRSDD